MNSPLSSESTLTLLKKVPMEESYILLPPNDDLVTESLHIFQSVRHRHIHYNYMTIIIICINRLLEEQFSIKR